jgi:cytochrome c556
VPYNRSPALLILLLMSAGVAAADSTRPASREEPQPSSQLDLPAHLRDLLKEEMRAVSDGIKSIAQDIGVGAYAAIETEAKKIQASYILNQRLSEDDARGLDHSLPEVFKALDLQFHNRAGALVSAAEEHDADLVLHHYSKLLETCVTCHSQYAAPRFPDLAPKSTSGHHAH